MIHEADDGAILKQSLGGSDVNEQRHVDHEH